MKKYIIKNCPVFNAKHEICNKKSKVIYCKNITDCLLKQIVKLCIGRQNICTECPSETCFDCENVTGGELATEIIDLLEIEEVNE